MSESDRIERSEHKTDAVQGNLPPPHDRSPPELDEAILKASRRAVRFHWLTSLLEGVHLSPIAGWQFVVGLTLGALVFFGLDTLFGDKPEPVSPGMIHAGDPPSSGSREEDAATRSPESWLRHIAVLVGEGRVAEAEAELRAFRQSYPDYEDMVRPEPPPRFP